MMFASRNELFFCTFLSQHTESAQPFPQAPNCRHLECVNYTVIHIEKDYEIRTYKEALWLSSPKDSKAAAREGFLLLFEGYFNGNDVANVFKTGPVLIDVQSSSYMAHFYVPQRYQNGNVPLPAQKQLKVEKLPQHKYAAVRRFDGVVNDATIAGGVAALRKVLKGTPYQGAADQDQFSVAGYNSAPQVDDRVNEVILWFD